MALSFWCPDSAPSASLERSDYQGSTWMGKETKEGNGHKAPEDLSIC